VLAESANLGAPERRTIATIERTAGRMRRLIDQLLIFTQGVAGGVPIQRDQVNLGEVCRTAVQEHSAQREVVIDDQLGVVVEVDGGRMTQLVDNLVTNAIRYGTGTVTVRLLRQDAAGFVLSVHNHGAPIDPAQISTLFDPYKRAVKKPGGIGLGLYIVEQIARAHGGTVSVTSTAEAGTTFAVQLPIHG
jgi:signal transduction histidine kinase